MNDNQPPQPPNKTPPVLPLGNPPQPPVDDTMNGDVQPLQHPAGDVPPAPLGNPPQQLDNPPAPQVNNPNVQLAPPPPAPFVLPSARTLADVIAAAHSQNPHLQLQPAQAALPINPKLNLMLFQQNVGTFPSHIITNAQLMRDITPTQLANFEESPHHKFALSVTNGSDHALFRVAYETPLDAQVETVLHTLSPYGALKVRLPLADPNSARINKYGGPSSIMVEVGNNAGAAAIRAQTTFGVHPGVAFWATDISH
ncbi:hypothetical protein B0H10DRAFT_1950839 [Mycena sp. CBHHK59/15]|nr:hypothetical protein B0H10DRAFT_1950839 [Mycena sp. CBHHK59/15]